MWFDHMISRYCLCGVEVSYWLHDFEVSSECRLHDIKVSIACWAYDVGILPEWQWNINYAMVKK